MACRKRKRCLVRHGIATFAAFVVAGAVPLMPYVVTARHGLLLSTLFTLLALFTVGSLRSLVTVDRWWAAGLEMLGLGVTVAAAAYGVGALAGAIAG